MKSFIKKALYFGLFFVLFSIIINGAFLGLITTTDWDFVKRLESLKFDNPDFELLVFGSSMCEYGIDTELITSKGIKSFNLAYVGCSVKSNFIQLNEYLTHYSKRPRYVILAINSYLENFNNETIQPVIDFTMKGHQFGLKDIPISKFNWQLMELLKKALRSEYRATYVTYGQKRNNMTGPDKTVYNESYLNIDEYKSTIWIDKMAKICDQNGIEFIVIDIPGIKETQNVSDIGPYKLKLENGGSADLYNLNAQDFCAFIDPNSDWIGMSHFNETGAAKFTSELLRITNLIDSEPGPEPQSRATN